ncbi:transposable element Tcb1 transposase [Trichonephila clavipes]|nr:transposable element Tcb1 transposase [Trichonephila clavipes]
MKTIQRELHTAKMHGRVAIPKPLVLGRNASKRLQWCRDHLNWAQLQWEQVIWSDESSFTLFQTTGRVFVWQTPTEAFHVDCLVPTVKHGGGSVMVWAAISSRGSGPLVVLRGMITGDHYRSILANHLPPMLQTLFPGERPVCSRTTTSLFTRHSVFKHGYMSMMMKWNI